VKEGFWGSACDKMDRTRAGLGNGMHIDNYVFFLMLAHLLAFSASALIVLCITCRETSLALR
jgi:hypothetical protein